MDLNLIKILTEISMITLTSIELTIITLPRQGIWRIPDHDFLAYYVFIAHTEQNIQKVFFTLFMVFFELRSKEMCAFRDKFQTVFYFGIEIPLFFYQ